MMKTGTSTGAGVKDFYRQKKKNASLTNISKSSAATFKKKLSVSPIASIDADIAPYFPLPQESTVDATEEALQQFDMNMKFGPCLGISRLDRWERASRLGLNPPEELRDLLRSASVKISCLWEGRV